MTQPHRYTPLTQTELLEESRKLLLETLHALKQQNRFLINPREKGDCTESYQLALKIWNFLDKSREGQKVYLNPFLSAPYGGDRQ